MTFNYALDCLKSLPVSDPKDGHALSDLFNDNVLKE
jgi:hypothetical protein